LPFVVHHISGWVLPGVYYTEQLRPYITTRTLHFTYGGDLHSIQSEWLRRASSLPAKQAAPYLCRYGFSGVLLQRNMLKRAAEMEKQWTAVLGEAPTFSRDQEYSFFDLRGFCIAHGIPAQDMELVKARLLRQMGNPHL
ncbi:MAG: hypothetical protein JSS21_04245, partial [Proteobacteria bacterium]|nr:hypothetical protein [Pseudomonadota bacterium]